MLWSFENFVKINTMPQLEIKTRLMLWDEGKKTQHAATDLSTKHKMCLYMFVYIELGVANCHGFVQLLSSHVEREFKCWIWMGSLSKQEQYLQSCLSVAPSVRWRQQYNSLLSGLTIPPDLHKTTTTRLRTYTTLWWNFKCNDLSIEGRNTWKSAHPPLWWACKVHVRWAVFCETTVSVS